MLTKSRLLILFRQNAKRKQKSADKINLKTSAHTIALVFSSIHILKKQFSLCFHVSSSVSFASLRIALYSYILFVLVMLLPSTTWAQLLKDNKVVEPMSVKQTTNMPTHKIACMVYVVNKRFQCVEKEIFGNYPVKREKQTIQRRWVVAATSTAAKQAILVMRFVAAKITKLLPIAS